MRRPLSGLLLALIALTLVAPMAAAQPGKSEGGKQGWEARAIRAAAARDRDRALLSTLPARARVGYHPETGRVRSLSGTHDRPLSGAMTGVAATSRRLSGGDARSSARRFVDRYGRLFGLRDPSAELRVAETRRRLGNGTAGNRRQGAAAQQPIRGLAGGRPNVSVRFRQVRGGVPVLGGEIVVQLSASGEVVSASGEVLPSAADAVTKPSVRRAGAMSTAATWLAREQGRSRSVVRTRSEGLALYDPRLFDDPFLGRSGSRLVWQIDARIPATRSQPEDHRLVLVDALGGGVLTSIGRIHDVDRRVCDSGNRPRSSHLCTSPVRTEGDGSSGTFEVDAVYRNMGAVLDYYADLFGRDGIDDEGSRMVATVRHCPVYGCPWRNAEWHWADQQAVFGTGWAKADDIVAHEFTHGVLDHEAPLLYIYQSGAINESYADIFGELIDLRHPAGTDTAGTRWKIGEDTPIGVFRDMRRPGRYGHPDRVRSPLWHTAPSDWGGVHRNSGVGNKAAFLIAQGGTFRGIRIRGIGRTKMARVFYQALTTRLTSAANYIDLADALIGACNDLVGRQGFRAANCKQVRKATRATQMHRKPRKFAPKSAPVCGRNRVPDDVFFDDLEDPGLGVWQPQRLAGTGRGWYYPQNPNNDPRWDGTWASSGDLNFYAPNRSSKLDSVIKLTEGQVLPERAYLRFEHGFGFDKDARRRYDGAIVQIRLDDGRWRGVNPFFTHGGYNGRIAKGKGNRLAGKRAYTGSSHGWSEARIDLSNFAGRSLKVRFRMSTDRSVGGLGWYIDDVRIYRCVDRDD